MPSLFLKLFQSYDVGLISCNEDLIHSPVAHFNLVKGQIALSLDLLLCFLLVLLLVICGDIVTSLKNQVLRRLVCLLIIGNFLFFLGGCLFAKFSWARSISEKSSFVLICKLYFPCILLLCVIILRLLAVI